MSLYATKDEDGELRDTAWDTPDNACCFHAYTDISVDDAKEAAKHRDSRVVELVEKAEPVEVSSGAGKWLTDLREELAHGSTLNSADYYVDVLFRQFGMSNADVFRALDVGWTVKQPKWWYVKAPKEWDDRGERQRFFKSANDSIDAIVESAADNSTDEQFTSEEINKYDLDGFETVEVTENAD